MRRLASLLGLVGVVPLLAQVPMAPLVGTVLDPAGKPVPGASVHVSRCDGRLFRCLDLTLRNEWHEIAAVRTDKAGRFGVQVPLGLALRLDVDVPPFARWRSQSVVSGEDVTVQLEAACTLVGRCVLGDTGKGTPCALRLWNPKTEVEIVAGLTAADGSFRFERLPSGPYCCDIDPAVAARPDWIEQQLASGETQTHEWRCAPGVELSGTVRDEATGAPIAGARVGLGWTFDKAVRTDAAGRYTLPGFGGSDVVDVQCEAPGFARQRIDCKPKNEAMELDFTLLRGGRVHGRVVDATGQPVANAYVAAVSMNRLTFPWQSCRTDGDGMFVCDGLPRLAEAMLMVRCPGFASVVYALPVGDAAGAVDCGRVTLPAPKVVRGVLRDAAGAPLRGVEVALRGTNEDIAAQATVPGVWSMLRNYLGERQVLTDANGAFAFGDVAPGEYGVAIGSMMEATPEIETIVVTAREDVPPLVLTR